MSNGHRYTLLLGRPRVSHGISARIFDGVGEGITLGQAVGNGIDCAIRDGDDVLGVFVGDDAVTLLGLEVQNVK